MTIEVKLNFKTDEPNLNGRIYKSDDFDYAMGKALERELILYHSAIDDNNTPDISDAIGLVEGYVNDKNNLHVDVHMFDNRFVDFMVELIEKELLQATIAGRGKVSNNEIFDYEIMYMFLTTDTI